MGLGNLKIGLRLYGGFGIVVLLAVVVGVIAIFGMYKLAGLTSKMYRHPLAVSNAVRDVKANINAMHRSMKDVALSEKIEDVNRFAAIVDDYEQNVYESFNIIFDQFLGDKSDVSKAHQAFYDWKIIRDEVIQLSRLGEKDKAVAITKGKGARHVAYMDDNIQFMIDFASNKAESFINNAQITKSNVIRHTIILISVMFVAGGIIALFITRSITVPVHKIIGRVKNIVKGDLEQKLDINRSDEIGKLSVSINQMSSQINAKTIEQDTINKLLRLNFESLTLNELMDKALAEILSVPWKSFQAKGTICLAEENDKKQDAFSLPGASNTLFNKCSKMTEEKCLCKKSIASRATVFACDRSEVSNGYYSISITSRNRLLGILNLCSKDDHQCSQDEEKTLETITQSLAGIIEKSITDKHLLQSDLPPLFVPPLKLEFVFIRIVGA